jgi:hypothetical protein
LFSLMNENDKINTETREFAKLFIKILYTSHKPKDYWAKKRGDQLAAPFTSEKTD